MKFTLLMICLSLLLLLLLGGGDAWPRIKK